MTSPGVITHLRPALDGPGAVPDLTVVIVTFNRLTLALTTLRSARAAARRLAVQWVVVDCGSTDGTPDAIEREWPDVQVLRGENVGFAAANNRALQIARGRYVLLLNPDAEVIDGTFDELLAFLEEHADIGVASVTQRAPDGSLEYSIRHYPSPWRAIGEALGGPRWTPLRGWREEEPRPTAYRSPRSVDWLVGAFLLARGDAVREVGKLDERFFLYSEEIDWCYRFRRAGWDVCHVPVMTITHHSASEPQPSLLGQLSYAKLLFARKHYGLGSTLTIHVALVVRHALRMAIGALAAPRSSGWRRRVRAERHALAVLLGLARPPFAVTADRR